MSRWYIHIITLVMAGYLAIVACDPNIKHYCSDDCEEHQECCHHHHHTYHCGVEIGEACHCGVTHIVAPESNIPIHHSLVPKPIIFHLAGTPAIVTIQQLTLSQNTFHINHAPPISIGGREVITLKSVLLI